MRATLVSPSCPVACLSVCCLFCFLSSSFSLLLFSPTHPFPSCICSLFPLSLGKQGLLLHIMSVHVYIGKSVCKVLIKLEKYIFPVSVYVFFFLFLYACLCEYMYRNFQMLSSCLRAVLTAVRNSHLFSNLQFIVCPMVLFHNYINI